MSIEGKGFFIWKVRDCEGGDPEAIANQAHAAGFKHVLLKIADGTYAYNIDRERNLDLLPPVVDALRDRGIEVWGWHYVYGADPVGEANMAIQRIQQLNLEGYVIDAEVEYKQPGKNVAAQKYMQKLRASLPNLPMALSSYRFPSYHPQLPWKVFLEKVDLNMPQVYWEQAHNADAQLERCVREFQGMTPFRPVFPTGPAYKAGGWRATDEDTNEFLDKAKQLGLKGANFFSWDECRRDLPNIWETVSQYSWTQTPQPEDIPQRYMQALNSHNSNAVTALYIPAAVHVTITRGVQGLEALRAWYNTLFNQLMPNGVFTLTGMSGTGNSRHFTWTASSSKGKISNGNDTFGLIDGKIAYHYSFFTISA